MSVPLTINGVTFNYPQQGDTNWGPTLTNWSIAVTNALAPLTGGFLTLPFPTSGIVFRNSTDTANLPLTVNGSNQLTFNGIAIGASTSLADNNFFIGNVSNVPTPHLLSGDVTTTNTGIVTIANGAITNAKIIAAAAISLNKLATLTASQIVVSDASGFLTTTASPTLTELGYVSGVTSAIQTQFAGIQTQFTTVNSTFLPLAGGTMSGAISMGSNKITALTSGSAAGEAVAYGQLKVIQTVRTTSSQQTLNVSSQVYQDTGLSASITLTKASNTVRIWYLHRFNSDSAGQNSEATPKVRIFRDNTFSLKEQFGAFGVAQNGGSLKINGQIQDSYDDLPGDTSAHTYKTQFANFSGNGLISLTDNLGAAVMILQEIAP